MQMFQNRHVFTISSLFFISIVSFGSSFDFLSFKFDFGCYYDTVCFHVELFQDDPSYEQLIGSQETCEKLEEYVYEYIDGNGKPRRTFAVKFNIVEMDNLKTFSIDNPYNYTATVLMTHNCTSDRKLRCLKRGFGEVTLGGGGSKSLNWLNVDLNDAGEVGACSNRAVGGTSFLDF